MNTNNSNSECKEYSIWYYDFLFEDKRNNIPDTDLKHIISCQYCQEEIKHLGSLISDSKEETNKKQREVDNAINKMISLHLSLVDIPVTCEMIKPFIPRLTDPLLQITVPTPVNTHLDNCNECSKDFNTIRDLALSHEQLGHLGEILADVSDEKSNTCSKVKAVIPLIVSLDFKGISQDILKHICTCSACRKEILQYRQNKHEELEKQKQYEKDICKNISQADLFNFCLPYGYDSVSYNSNKDLKSLKSHIQNCVVCQNKIQQLLTTIDNIAERPDSGVITKFSLGKSNELSKENLAEIYPGRPVNVKMLDKTALQEYKDKHQSENDTKEKPNIIKFKFKKYAKPFATAAAIILAFSLFFYSSSAKGIDLSQIYKALENINNAYITRWNVNEPSPIQEQWISRTFNVIITKTQDQYVLWDINSNIRKINNSVFESTETAPLPQDVYNRVKLTIANVLGILPFQDLSRVPKNAKWSHINMEKTEHNIIGTSIYELVWTLDDNYIHKCRFFVDDSTYLVQKTEYYYKYTNQKDFELKSIEEFKYINDTEIEEVLNIFQTSNISI